MEGHDFGVERRQLAIGGQLLDLRTPGGVVTDVLVPLHGRHQATTPPRPWSRSRLSWVRTRALWGPGPTSPLGARGLDPDTVRAWSPR